MTNGFGQVVDSVQKSLDTIQKTILKNDSLINTDSSSINSSQSVNSSKMLKNNDVETTVNYNAKDSIFMDVIHRKAFLYGDAHIDYGEVTIDAAYIEIDWAKNEVFAKGIPDSTGKNVGLPIFKDGDEVFTSREMRYNFETKKGIISEIVTQEGEGYIHGETVKMNPQKELFIGDAVYTTCNLEHPHFAIHSKKIKVIPDKVAVTGPFNISIADIPTPLGFVFGIFPFPKDKSSGVIVPAYGESADRGFFLQNGGFYWAVNDYLGSTWTGDIYTNGSWRLNWATDYKKRYSYDGNTIIALTNNKSGFDKEESVSPGYRIYWKHSPVGKKNSNLTSSVDIKSANYNRNNTFNPDLQLRNSFSSSVSYSKKFGKSPFNLTVSLRQDQTDSIQNYTLPDLSFGMQRINPLKRLGDNPKAWYSQLGVGYKLNAKNKVTNLKEIFVDGISEGSEIQEINFLDLNELSSYSDNGLQHTLPITLPKFTLFKYLNVTPTTNYNEYWYGKELTYTFVDSINGVVKDTNTGFSRTYNYSYNAALTTRIFGYLEVNELGLLRVKHTMSPSIGFSYNPDFSDSRFGFYDSYIDTNGTEKRYSHYQSFVMGGPSQGERQTMSFSISNILEGKVKSKKDTIKGFQYVKFFESLVMSSSYNFAADSLNLAPLAIAGRTTIKGVNIQFNTSHDFYEIDSTDTGTEYKKDQFLWDREKIMAARLTSFNLAISTDLNPQKRKKKYESDKEEEQESIDYINNNIDDYVDFSIPWSLNIGYNLRLNKSYFEKTVSQSLTLSGDVSLTPKWKIGWNSGYDLEDKEMTPTQLSIIRDLHCWEMKFNWVPFGYQKSYSFDINVKASVLQDLKLSKKDQSINR